MRTRQPPDRRPYNLGTAARKRRPRYTKGIPHPCRFQQALQKRIRLELLYRRARATEAAQSIYAAGKGSGRVKFYQHHDLNARQPLRLRSLVCAGKPGMELLRSAALLQESRTPGTRRFNVSWRGWSP